MKLLRLFLLLIFVTASIEGQVSESKNFLEFLEDRISKAPSQSPQKRSSKEKLQDVCPIEARPGARKILMEYGAVFSAGESVRIPDKCIFLNENEVREFQSKLRKKKALIGQIDFELQEAAMDSLIQAVSDAKAARLSITPRDGRDAGARNYVETVVLWNSRFEPALNSWVSRKKITPTEARSVRSMSVLQMTEAVLEWEKAELYFGTGLSTPILTSVAPPGASQHISMLAFDVVEHGNAQVRAILAKNGWFQTVKNDLPHFTYLGVKESELEKRGLKLATVKGRRFWIPAF